MMSDELFRLFINVALSKDKVDRIKQKYLYHARYSELGELFLKFYSSFLLGKNLTYHTLDVRFFLREKNLREACLLNLSISERSEQ